MRCAQTLLIAVALGIAGVPTAQAQDFPNQPIRIISPFAPGGGVEVTLRLVARKLTEFGWPQVIVDNRPGGPGTVAAIATKQARPDGYTLMQGDIASHAIGVVMTAQAPYDPVADFTPITLMWTFPSILTVPASSPAKTAQDLIALARSKPDGLTYVSQGPGSGGHLLGAMFQKALGAPMVHVPYKGAGPALIDLAAGRADLIFASYASVGPLVESGKLRMLAVTSKERLKILPTLPTMTEIGHPDVFLDAWFGLVGPAGLPDRIVTILHDRVGAVLNAPDMVSRLADQGQTIATSTPGQFRELIRSEVRRLGPIVKDAGAFEN